MTRTAVLVDFGGVLTTSVLQAFEDFGAPVGAVPGLLLELLRNDAACRKLLVEHESGGIDTDAFDRGFAERLHAHGVGVDPDRLSVRMQAGLRRDDDTVRLIEELRSARVPIALVSNAFWNRTMREKSFGLAPKRAENSRWNWRTPTPTCLVSSALDRFPLELRIRLATKAIRSTACACFKRSAKKWLATETRCWQVSQLPRRCRNSLTGLPRTSPAS